MYWIVGAVLFAPFFQRMYQKYSVSTKNQFFLARQLLLKEFLPQFAPLIVQDVNWISVVIQQHHLPHHGLACRNRSFCTLLQRMYQKYSMSAKRQSFLFRGMPLTEYPSFLLADICGYCVGQYHVPTNIRKIWLFLFGYNTTFGANSSQVYIDYGILSRYQIVCRPQYNFLSMSVMCFSCQNSHNPSIEGYINVQTSDVWGMCSPLNQQEICKV